MTTIEWTDVSWNPVTGCSKISQGCKHCYAERVFPRAYGRARVDILADHDWEPNPDDGFQPKRGDKIGWRERQFTDVVCHPERLQQPLRWRKPRRVFVNSMSDLFHEDVPDSFIDQVFAVMALAPQHTFQILTKRPERMQIYVARPNGAGLPAVRIGLDALELCLYDQTRSARSKLGDGVLLQGSDINPGALVNWPLPNVWLGVSVEDQATADERVHDLRMTPAACRFVSYEPALAWADLTRLNDVGTVATNALTGMRYDPRDGHTLPGEEPLAPLDWLIVGGESGPGARPFNVQWARDIIGQCKAAGVPAFVKQLGARPWMQTDLDSLHDYPPIGCAWPLSTDYPLGACVFMLRDRKGGDMDEWPEDLRVRESPKVAA